MAPVLIYQTLYLNIKLIFQFGYKEDILLGLKINILAAPSIDENTFLAKLIRSRPHIQVSHTISIALYGSNLQILNKIEIARF